MKNIFLLSILLMVSNIGFSQRRYTHPKYFNNLIENTDYILIGSSIGAAQYKGAYGNFGDFGNIQPNINIYVQKKVSKNLSFRYQFSYVGLGSKDMRANSETYNQNAFNADIIEFIPMLIYDLGARNRKRNQRINYYLMAGVGVFYGSATNHLKNTSSNKAGGVIYGGAGVRYSLTNKWSINLEAQGRVSSSDQLDMMTNRNFPTDMYGTINIGVAYRIFGRRKLH
ncbi:outer membrane beta-barrel protein [Flammeovirga kamogawensis]|uniref:Porin family protein n=1 Tax=Flammeovirga kamogawensis TaxID=373891 RepID=A0ABX8H1M7_9BACT|nr:outer membrane beta-barrel protein [Flammeovirga kamogawensis]MBB6462653.1 hypothetical protein [Flammeovirga kamogawensis]QWG09603.1 porin family protein [Flammeovirga kamogawensis]TRX65118.1 porin family protein [Flammeovirga kamogawensis]